MRRAALALAVALALAAPALAQQQGGGAGPARSDDLLRAAGERLGDPSALEARVDLEVERRAAEAGIAIDRAEQSRREFIVVERWAVRFFGGERSRLDDFLETALGLDAAEREALVRRRARTALLEERLAGRERAVPDAVLRERYRRLYGERGERLLLRQAFFATDPSLSPLYTADEWRKDAAAIEQEARSRADEALAALAKGAPFEEVARRLSDDPSSALAGGDLGYGWAGRFGTAFDAAARALPSGGRSPVVRGEQGLHVIEVLSVEPGYAYRAHRILFAPRAGGDPEAARAEALRRAQDARAEAQAGRPLAELALRSDEEWGRASGGLFRQGGAGRNDPAGAQGGRAPATAPPPAPPEVAAALETLAPGAISEPVLSPRGWWLVQVVSREPAPGLERRRVRHILAGTDHALVRRRRLGPALPPRAKRLAEQALARVQGGEPLEKIAREVSEDPSRERGGALPDEGLERYGAAFAKAVRALEPGKPAVLESALGVHVVLLERREKRAFEDARPDLLATERERPGDEREAALLRERIRAEVAKAAPKPK